MKGTKAFIDKQYRAIQGVNEVWRKKGGSQLLKVKIQDIKTDLCNSKFEFQVLVIMVLSIVLSLI